MSLAEGSHTITATARDSAGNRSDPSAPRAFEVDAGAPTLTITTPQRSVLLSGDRIAGTAGDNRGLARIEIRWLNALRMVVATQTVPVSGTSASWSAEPPMGVGYFTAEVTAVDAVGNRSPVRTVTVFVIRF